MRDADADVYFFIFELTGSMDHRRCRRVLTYRKESRVAPPTRVNCSEVSRSSAHISEITLVDQSIYEMKSSDMYLESSSRRVQTS
jgi:hypothetical protein